MKNDLKCNGCMYKQVPSHFSPCLGCINNMDRLADVSKTTIETLNKPIYEHVGVMNRDGSMAYALTKKAGAR